jgi:hypothetical protein
MSSLLNNCLQFAKTAGTKATGYYRLSRNNSVARNTLFTTAAISSAAFLYVKGETWLAQPKIQTSVPRAKKQQLEVIHSFIATHPEYKNLIDKIGNLVQFQRYAGAPCSRGIAIGYDEFGNNPIYIKVGTPPVGSTSQNPPLARNEELAFIISHRFDLAVVPPTMALENYQPQIEQMLPKFVLEKAKSGINEQNELCYDNVVIQEGVANLSQQISRINPIQAQNAILLNILLGRSDAAEKNTVITKNGQCMEVDNEYIGHESTNSWLCSHFANQTFDPGIVQQFLSHPPATLEHIFRSFPVDPKVQKRITTNLESMRTFFALQPGKAQVKDLLKFMQQAKAKS